MDGLKSVVRQHMKIAALIAEQRPEQSEKLFLKSTEELLYAMDSQDINELYTQTDAVFSLCGLDPAPETADFQRSVTVEHSSDEVSNSSVNTHVLVIVRRILCYSGAYHHHQSPSSTAGYSLLFFSLRIKPLMDQSSFDAAFFQEAGFALTPLPVSLLFKDASFVCQQENPPTVEPTVLSSPTRSESIYDASVDPDLIKKEARRLKDRIRRRKTMLRRKCEREALQWQISELTKQVDALKRKSSEETVTSAWKSADSQLHSLQALADNRRLLRQEVRKRAMVIAQFREVLHEQLRQVEVPPKMPLPQTEDNFPGSTLLRQFVQELPAVYAQTTNALESCYEDSISPDSPALTTLRKREGTTEFFQTYGKQLMPFEFSQTCEYLWQLFVLEHREKDRQILTNLEDPENIRALRFRVRATDRHPSLCIHYATRRYVEKDCTVIVWRGLTEGEGAYSGMHSDETGWCIVRAAADLAACSTVEACIRLIPIYLKASTTASAAEQFTSMLLRTVEEDAVEVATKLERLLLDDALDGIDLDPR
ncbi:unnamed protein product [Phytophthora lilii]|uniref:Unnamed protein product n=1 Tax=Phytophthora lilii TaxID=2077276 RepID=A0A9W6WQ90_9STRA|nr:unnamed protein product [Phytophthora lilii]